MPDNRDLFDKGRSNAALADPWTESTAMTQASTFGQRLGKFLHLKDAPPSLITRSLRSAELAVTETRNDDPVPGLSGSLARGGRLSGQPEIS